MNKKNWAAITLLNAMIVVFISCQTAQQQSEPNTVNTDKKPSTQALLLLQPFEYDDSDKDKVVGPYEFRNQVVIPTNLATQSKWIMFEGPVLENNVIAYRFYADSRHRFDIYAKTVPTLVMDTVSWQYHDIMDWGTDVLKVGNSLGIGSPAIYTKDSLYTLSNSTSKIIEVVDTDNSEIAHIRTTFENLIIARDTFNLIQDWTLKKDEAASEITLTLNKPLPADTYFATGIVKHLEQIQEVESDAALLAYNWGIQSYHEENMGMALVCPKTFQPKKIDDPLSHVYIFENASITVHYKFLAAWERDNSGVKSSDAFASLVKKASY